MKSFQDRCWEEFPDLTSCHPVEQAVMKSEFFNEVFKQPGWLFLRDALVSLNLRAGACLHPCDSVMLAGSCMVIILTRQVPITIKQNRKYLGIDQENSDCRW